MGPLELRICPGPGSVSTGTSSSPVARMATRGRANTSRSTYATGRRQRDLARMQNRAGCQQLIPLVSLRALEDDIFAHLDDAGRQQPDGFRRFSAAVLNMLQHHHRVGAGGNRSPGHDLPRRARPQRTGGRIAGTRSAPHREGLVPRSLSCPAGKAIPSGTGKRGLIAIGDQRAGQDTAIRCLQIHALHSPGRMQPSRMCRDLPRCFVVTEQD